MKKSISSTALIVTILVIVTSIWLFHALGYRVVSGMTDAGKRAEELVINGGKATDCLKLKTFFPTYPPLGMIQSGCIEDYAKLSQDPTACELLLPSEYGWGCFGGISNKIFADRLCTGSGPDGLSKVYCNQDSEGVLSIENPQIEDCAAYQRTDLREWCLDAQTTHTEGVYACEEITRAVVKDHCEFNYAVKNLDSALCNNVQDIERRNYCLFYVQMAIKYKQ